MKKLVLLAALLAPCVPSLLAGIDSQNETVQAKRDSMLSERFEIWCSASGYNCHSMSETEKNNLWDDFWSETDDYLNACDSIDRVICAEYTSDILK